MRTQYIGSPDLHWVLFNEEVQGFLPTHEDSLNFTASILFAVKQVFDEFFGYKVVNSRSPLSVLHCNDGPVTYRHHHLIFLSTHGCYPAQIVYQFAHELFHFMLKDDVWQEYQWLNEVLAELCSLLTLSRIAEKPSRYAKGILANYHLAEYAVSTRQNEQPLADMPVSKFIETNLLELQKNSCNRIRNRTIANSLYDFFQTNPTLWRVMLHLPEFSASNTLLENLQNLKGIEPDESLCIDGLIHILCF